MSFLIGLPFKLFDFVKIPAMVSAFWTRFVHMSVLTEDEIAAAKVVLGDRTIKFEDVRIAERGILTLIFKANRNKAITTFRIMNFPSAGSSTRASIALLVHELTHVAQFNTVGSVYIPQALCAQFFGKGYEYGEWQQLKIDRSEGRHFSYYNREQQGQIAQDYQRIVIEGNLPDDDEIKAAYTPFIEELQNGSF